MKKHTTLFAALWMICALVAITSCKKDKDTIATILVLNASGNAVPGATVRLYSSPSVLPPPPNELRFDTLGVTNGAGKVTFNFSDFYKKGQAGFAVLDIQAYKGSLYGVGIIKIEEETTNEEKVTIQ